MEEDAIQKRPGVYPGVAVPSVERIKVPNAVVPISTSRMLMRTKRVIGSASVLGYVPFQREARLLRSQVAFARESP